MHLDRLLLPRDHLLPRQSGECITCPDPPPCNCNSHQSCFLINRDCYTCSSYQCVSNFASSSAPGGGSSGSGGVSKGALGGAIVGVLVFLAGAITLFLWYRRRLNARRENKALDDKPDVPAPAETVLNRPDPTEKPPTPPIEPSTVRVYSSHSSTTINLDPESGNSTSDSPMDHFNSVRSSTQSNPFGDDHSIQTTSTSTQATNVIPIALVPPGSVLSAETSPSYAPQRPIRSPELDLNLEHVNVPGDEGRALTPYASSARSGVSGVSSRNSYMSNASYSSDFLNEAPVIVTPVQGAVRQVLGVHKAEMLQTPPGSQPTSPDSLKPSITARPSVRSPLAATSFTPADIVKESGSEEQEILARSPFGDEFARSSPSFSIATFGTPSPGIGDYDASLHQHVQEPRLPWAQSEDSRPSSISTQAGSIVDIGSATRVKVGLDTLHPDSSIASGNQTFPRSPYRTTIGRLVSPSSGGSAGTLQEQQQRALAHAQAQAQAQGFEGRRASGSSTVSATADSILESFPFVPPSPISDRPVRSPPRSPLAQQSFSSNTSPSKEPPKPRDLAVLPESAALPPLPPPNRKVLGLSTASQLSTASSGLGSFPFQIDSDNGTSNASATPPSSFPGAGRQRASLDTLALTSDLSSYPLGFDRDSFPFKG